MQVKNGSLIFFADEEMKVQVFAQNLPGIRSAGTETRNSNYLVLEVVCFTSERIEVGSFITCKMGVGSILL